MLKKFHYFVLPLGLMVLLSTMINNVFDALVNIQTGHDSSGQVISLTLTKSAGDLLLFTIIMMLIYAAMMRKKADDDNEGLFNMVYQALSVDRIYLIGLALCSGAVVGGMFQLAAYEHISSYQSLSFSSRSLISMSLELGTAMGIIASHYYFFAPGRHENQ